MQHWLILIIFGRQHHEKNWVWTSIL